MNMDIVIDVKVSQNIGFGKNEKYIVLEGV